MKKTYINPFVELTEVKNNIIATSGVIFGDGTTDSMEVPEGFFDFNQIDLL